MFIPCEPRWVCSPWRETVEAAEERSGSGEVHRGDQVAALFETLRRIMYDIRHGEPKEKESLRNRIIIIIPSMFA